MARTMTRFFVNDVESSGDRGSGSGWGGLERKKFGQLYVFFANTMMLTTVVYFPSPSQPGERRVQQHHRASTYLSDESTSARTGGLPRACTMREKTTVVNIARLGRGMARDSMTRPRAVTTTGMGGFRRKGSVSKYSWHDTKPKFTKGLPLPIYQVCFWMSSQARRTFG